MSRSYHATRKALVRERKFAANDSPSPHITELEISNLKKHAIKLNVHWQKQSRLAKTPVCARMTIAVGDEVEVLKQRRNDLKRVSRKKHLAP